MSLELLMAFTVADDEERQLQVWEMIADAHDPSPSWVRRKLTENSVRVSDKRVRFVGLDAYVEAGGSVVRDLFETDNGGVRHEVGLTDRLCVAKPGGEERRGGGGGGKGGGAGRKGVG